jgi:hypothetical protein
MLRRDVIAHSTALRNVSALIAGGGPVLFIALSLIVRTKQLLQKALYGERLVMKKAECCPVQDNLLNRTFDQRQLFILHPKDSQCLFRDSLSKIQRLK